MAQETNDRNRRLQELGGSDFEVADGQPDIRGWDVKDTNGQRIGEVDDLIFDTESRKVRYMKIDLEGNVLDLEARDVLVPIGLAQLHDNDDDVILSNVSADQLRSLPEYDDDNLDSDFESGIRRVFGNNTGAALTGAALTSGTDTNRDSDFYNHDHFNDDNLYRNRRQTSDTNALPVRDEDTTDRSGIRLRNRANNLDSNASMRDEFGTAGSTSIVNDTFGNRGTFNNTNDAGFIADDNAALRDNVSTGSETTGLNDTTNDTDWNTSNDSDTDRRTRNNDRTGDNDVF